MAFMTGNALGSSDVRDLKDNAVNIDWFANGPASSYPDRFGTQRKSVAQMNAEYLAAQVARANEFIATQNAKQSAFDAAQLARANEFAEDQDNREAQFNTFMDASGYEPPISYAPGILLDRTTKTVSYLGNEYRAKGSFIPMTTDTWSTDEAKLKLIGDDSLRQDLASPVDGASNVAYEQRTVKARLDDTPHMRDKGLSNDNTAAQNEALLPTAFAEGAYDLGGARLSANKATGVDVTKLHSGVIVSTQESRPQFPEDLVFPNVAQTRNRSISDARNIIESELGAHTSVGSYTMLTDGVVVRGREIYFGMNAVGHHPQPNGGDSQIIAYIRNPDGSFDKQVVVAPIPGYNLREPHVSVSRDGSRVLLAFEKAAVDGSGTATYSGGIYYALDASLAVILGPVAVGSAGRYCYGRPVEASDGRVLLTNYGATDTNDVALYRSNAGVNSVASFAKVTSLFPATAGKIPNETIMGYWGDKLVAVARRQNGANLVALGYTYTYDLTGLGGWREVEELPSRDGINPWLAAPNIPHYTKSDEPLIVIGSGGPGSRRGTWTIFNQWGRWSTPQMYETNNSGTGAYNAIVRTDRGFGVTAYEEMGLDANTSRATRIWHTYMRKDRIIPANGYIDYVADRMIMKAPVVIGSAPVHGNPARANAKYASNGQDVRYHFESKDTLLITAVHIPVASNSGTITAAVQLHDYATDALIATFDTLSVSSGNMVIGRFNRASPISLAGGRYYIRIMTANQKAFSISNPLMLGGQVDMGGIVSFGVGIGAGAPSQTTVCPIGIEFALS